MLQNDLQANHYIYQKQLGWRYRLLFRYGFHTTWTEGVGNDATFSLALYKRKMVD